MIRRLLLAIGLVVLALAGPSAAPNDHWPQFRGLSAGVAENDPALPERWSTAENIVWTLDMPGAGWSSPVVWGDHVFVTTVINSGQSEAPKPGLYFGGERPASTAPHRWMVHDVDFATGKVRWSKEVRNGVPAGPKHLKNSYASETPVTDGERVYVYFGNVGLFVFDMKGTPVWSKPIGPFKTRNGWGTAASPVLHRDRIYIVNDNDDQSFLAAYDKRTGAEAWRVNRAEGTNWATPFVWEHDGRAEIVTSGSDRVRSYDLTGKLLWEFKGMSSISIPTPFERHGLLFISSGYVGDALRPAYAIRPGASGDISLKPGETTNPVHRVVGADAGALQPDAAGLRGLLLHAVRSRLLHLPRRQDRQGDLRASAHRGGRQRLHDVAVGVQRQDLRHERGRRHLRDPGWPGVQGAR